MNKTFWLIAGGIAAVFIFLKIKMAKALDYSIYSIGLGGNLTQPQILLTLQITNPTEISATVNSINANIFSNGVLIGNIIAQYNTALMRNGITLFDLPINVSLAGALNEIIDTIQQKGTKIEIKGTMTADFIPLPLDIVYEF